MTVVSVLAVLVVVFVAVVLGAGAWGARGGVDLLDWDPGDRIRARRGAELDEVARGLDEHNRRRAVDGLPPQTVDELRRELARRARESPS